MEEVGVNNFETRNRTLRFSLRKKVKLQANCTCCSCMPVCVLTSLCKYNGITSNYHSSGGLASHKVSSYTQFRKMPVSSQKQFCSIDSVDCYSFTLHFGLFL